MSGELARAEQQLAEAIDLDRGFMERAIECCQEGQQLYWVDAVADLTTAQTLIRRHL